MKITIGTTRAFHLIHLARELAEHGHDVTVIGYVPVDRMKFYNLGKAKYISIFSKTFPESAKALQPYFLDLQTKATDKMFSIADIEISNSMQFCDVYIGLSGMAVESLNKAKTKYGAVTICERGSSHVATQRDLLSQDGINRLTDNYVARELQSYKYADLVALPSLFAVKSFLRNGVENNKLFLNHYGVNLERFYGNVNGETDEFHSPRKLRTLFVGGWSYQKGCDILAKVVDSSDDLQLTHAGVKGDAPMPNTPRCTALGHIQNDVLRRIYVSHDVCILPSRQDGFGMVILEAYACGLHVIGTPNTGVPDLLDVMGEDAGVHLMQEVNEEELQRCLNKVRSQGRRRPSAAEMTRFTSYFSWRQYGNRYHNFLESIKNRSNFEKK